MLLGGTVVLPIGVRDVAFARRHLSARARGPASIVGSIVGTFLRFSARGRRAKIIETRFYKGVDRLRAGSSAVAFLLSLQRQIMPGNLAALYGCALIGPGGSPPR